MGDSDNGVTLKIDADTAAYLTQMVRLGSEHKKAGEHVEKWGNFLDDAKHKAREMAVEVTSFAAACELVKGVWEGITHDMEAALHHTESMLDKTQKLASLTGEGRAKIQAEIASVKDGPLTHEQMTDAVTAFRSMAPGSTATVSTATAAMASSRAAVAGMDPNAFAGMAGNLYGAMGAKSFDAAAMLTQHLGGEAEGASVIMKKMSERMGADTAAKMLPTLLASYDAGDRKMGFVNEALGEWHPGLGDFGSFLGRSKARFTNQNRYNQIMSHMGKDQAEVEGMGGTLNRMTDKAMSDREYAEYMRTRADKATTEAGETAANAPAATWIERQDAARDRADIGHPLKKWTWDLAMEGLDRFDAMTGMRGGNDISGDKQLWSDILAGIHAIGSTLKETKNISSWGFSHKRLRPDAHGEKAP